MKITSAAIIFAFLVTACGGNEAILRSGKETPTPVATVASKPPIERELDAMRTAGFSNIYVVKRKDGAKLESDDRGFIKANTAEANRRVASEDGMAVVIGTNTQFTAEKLTELNKRFAVEDHSETAPANTKTNSETNK